MKKYFTIEFEQKIIEVCNTSLSMASACAILQMNHNTFIRHAKRLGVYKPNPSGKGLKKKRSKIPTIDILNGLYPQYHTYKLLLRLLNENYKEHMCECCSNTHWNGVLIPIELHHIDGNRFNHNLNNLQILCPNCHAQTSNYKIHNSK